jgi:hypothetical protein
MRKASDSKFWFDALRGYLGAPDRENLAIAIAGYYAGHVRWDRVLEQAVVFLGGELTETRSEYYIDLGPRESTLFFDKKSGNFYLGVPTSR